MTYVKTEGRDPTICRDQSDLSKMPSFYTYGGQCQPAYLVAIAGLASNI
jgi:hypothetical protein